MYAINGANPTRKPTKRPVSRKPTRRPATARPTYRPDATRRPTRKPRTPTSVPTATPSASESTSYDFSCPTGTFVTQFFGLAASGVNSIGVKCSGEAISLQTGGLGGVSTLTTVCPQGIQKILQITGGAAGMGIFTSFCGVESSSMGSNQGAWAGSNSTSNTCSGQDLVVGITVSTTLPIGNSDASVQSVAITCGRINPVETFSITLENVGPEWSPGVAAAFATAKAKWESIITKGFPDVLLGSTLLPNQCGNPTTINIASIDDIVIIVNIKPIDGPYTILGYASVCRVRNSNGLPIISTMVFDSDDLDILVERGSIGDTILHEMGHCLGFGITKWNAVNTSTFQNTFDTYFPGPKSITAFNAAGGNTYKFGKVPVANVGGIGSINSHWRESVLKYELMTPGLQIGVPSPLSIVTIGALEDMGYSVNYGFADPWVYNSGAVAFSLASASEDTRVHVDDVLHGDITVIDDETNEVVAIIPARKME